MVDHKSDVSRDHSFCQFPPFVSSISTFKFGFPFLLEKNQNLNKTKVNSKLKKN